MGYVLLHVWMRAEDDFVQQYTLRGLSEFLSAIDTDKDPNKIVPKFYSAALAIMPVKAVVRSLRRDWKNMESCRLQVGVPMHTTMFLRSEALNAPLNLDTPMERKLLLSSFGACRKQHCMGSIALSHDHLFRSVVLMAL